MADAHRAPAFDRRDAAGGKRVAREVFTFGLVRPVGQDWEFVAVRATPLAPPAAPN